MKQPGADDVAFSLHEHVLENGLRVIVQEDHARPLVAVHLMFHVGSANETAGRRGFAHLFEHLLFQGSEHVPPAGHFRFIEEAGGTCNGSTWFDRTNYYETLPAGGLELALWLESDRMGFSLPAITPEKLHTQREVVKNERRQSYENRPYGLAVETVLHHAYPPGHPYRHPTIGFMEDLDAATLSDVEEFFTTYYGPGNAVLVLAGDVRTSDAMRQVERYFGSIPPRPDPPQPAPAPVEASRERRALLADRVIVPRVYMHFHAPPVTDPDFEALDLLASVLAEGQSSRLYRELVYRRRLAEEVHAFVWPLERSGMFWIIATARAGVDAAELEAGIDAAIDELRASGPSAEELDGARNRTCRQLIVGLRGVGGRADELAHAAVLRKDAAYVNAAFARYRGVTALDVRRVAEKCLRGDRRTVLHVVPAEASPRADSPTGRRSA